MSPRIENPNLLHLSFETHQRWLKKRPLIEIFNQDLGSCLKLLVEEISELNGGDKVGIFAKEDIKNNNSLREDYRQQELTDIIVFLMTVLHVMLIDLNVEQVYEYAQQEASSFGYKIVDLENSQLPPLAMNEDQNQIFEILKGNLNSEAQNLYEFDVNQDDPSVLVKPLEKILAHCVAMQSLIGVNSAQAVFEKEVRNSLKYKEEDFQIPEKYSDFEELEKKYMEKRRQAGEIFDGDTKKGTTEFYKPYEPVEYEIGEGHGVGLFYQVLARLIATSWGFTVRFNKHMEQYKLADIDLPN